MDSGGSADSAATRARLWIEANVALFVVIVIAAVLLLVAVVTVLLYCCCCRRKKAHWVSRRGRLMSGGEVSKSSGSHLQVDSGWRVDTMDGDSARVSGAVEVEHKVDVDHREYSVEQESSQQLQLSADVTAPDIVVSVSPDEVDVEAEAEAEYPGLPPLPQGLVVTAGAELRIQEPRLDADAELDAEIEGSRPLRLPRTEVILRTESPSWEVQQQPQRQQQLKSAPPPVAQSSSFTVATRPHVMMASNRSLRDSGRPSHEHLHGSTIYQSDDNEITIVDSDFSDYEDSPEDEARKRAVRLSAGLGLDVGVEAAAATADDFGWETLPNQTVVAVALDRSGSIEEAPILAVDRSGEEYVPTPSPSLEEQQARREDNLAELDKTLGVFEHQVDDDPDGGGGGGGGGFGVSLDVEIGGGSGQEVQMSAGFVDEEEILPTDRSQVPH